MSRAPRALVATEQDRCPRRALAHARAVAGADGDVVLARILVVPVSQPIGASLDLAVERACAVLDEGDRVAGDIDTRLLRARTFAKGVLGLLEAERFDVLVLERGPGPLRNGPAAQLELILERADAEVVLIRLPPEASPPERGDR